MRTYEMMYIVSPEVGDESYAASIEKVNGYITRLGGEVGEINQTSPWGKRRLAYPINKQTDGYYVVTTFKLEPKNALELERNMRLSEEILRHLIVGETAK